MNFIRKLKSNYEAIGLIIILLSFTWQQFENESISLKNTEDLYQTHLKIDAIGAAIVQDYWENHKDEFKTLPKYNVEAFFENWNYWEDLERNKESLKKQIAFGRNIRIILYIIGSILIVSSKLKTSEKT